MTAVLFTCTGQRVDIVTAFRAAGATTIATDVDQLAPALYHADRRALVASLPEQAPPEAREVLELAHAVVGQTVAETRAALDRVRGDLARSAGTRHALVSYAAAG